MSLSNRKPYLIALGANLAPTTQGNLATLRAALAQLAAELGPARAVSGFWQTPAFPPGAGPDFVNACAAVESELEPAAMLALLHRVEAALGRERARRWGPRAIDLDLLAQGGRILPDAAGLRRWMDLPPEDQRTQAPDRLILPHPRLHERGFVLVPLAEIAPDWVHPALGLDVVTLRDRLAPAERAAIRRL